MDKQKEYVKRSILLVIFLVNTALMPLTVYAKDNEEDNSGQRAGQTSTPQPTAAPASAAPTGTPQPTIAPTVAPSSTAVPTATPQPTGLPLVGGLVQDLAAKAKIVLHEPEIPVNTPKPLEVIPPQSITVTTGNIAPTHQESTPIPVKATDRPTTGVVKQSTEPTPSSTANPNQQVISRIKPPLAFLTRSLDQEFYAEASLSKSMTDGLLVVSAALFLVGLSMVKPALFPSLVGLFRVKRKALNMPLLN